MATKTEEKAWYRLLKVLYGAGWLTVVVITLLTFLIVKPSGKVEMSRSGFTCPDGKSFTWTSYSGFYTKNDKSLDEKDHISALQTCGLYKPEYFVKDLDERKADAIAKGFSEDEIARTVSYGLPIQAEKVRNNPPYEINWVTDNTNANKWMWSVIWAIVAFLIAYLLLDTIKNVVLYVLFGKRFSYPLISAMQKS